MIQGLDTQTASIYAPIQTKLTEVEAKLHSLRQTTVAELEPLLDHALNAGGKRVRPAITLLAADFYPHDPENPIIMAAAVELLHLATLIHDDTVDNSDLRRGQATVSNRWGKHVAVLFGDYVFAASATFVCDTNNVRVIRRFSETIMELASGEIIEYFNCFNPQQARELYQDRIYRKTASLFCTAAESGAILGGAPEPQVQALRDFGYNIGMAFQIVDDLLDVQGDPQELGKPVGNDLLQGVLTLPSIMLLERYPENNPIEELFREKSQDGLLQQTLDMINNSNIIADCFAVIRGYCAKASESLSLLPDGPAKDSLLQLPQYIRERTR
ncbi:MAG: polyprenyl synthetase family protein [Dehalococcoidia bacterium]